MKCFKNLLLLFIVFSIGCNSSKQENKNPLYFFNDMESLDGWVNVPTIMKFKGHSGDFVSKADTINPYSISFKKRIGDICSNPIMKAEVSFWVYFTSSKSTGTIVCAIDSFPGKPFVYLAQPFEMRVDKARNWTYIRQDFYFPENQKSDFVFAAYIGNSGKHDIYVDDIAIELAEYKK